MDYLASFAELLVMQSARFKVVQTVVTQTGSAAFIPAMGANALRWAFAPTLGAAPTVYMAPVNNLSFGFAPIILNANEILLVTFKDYAAMVTGEWYIYDNVASPAIIWEIIAIP